MTEKFGNFFENLFRERRSILYKVIIRDVISLTAAKTGVSYIESQSYGEDKA